MKYDYLVVGAGLFGSVFAHETARAGKNVLVIDKRSHVSGNIYTENRMGINVHMYGAHIFHTSDKKVWEYINRFTEYPDKETGNHQPLRSPHVPPPSLYPALT